MAIIYTYPEKTTPVLADVVLITDSESTNPSNQTKTITLSSIKDSIDVVDSIVAGSGITVSGSTGAVTITNAGVKSLVSANTAIVASSSAAGGTGALTITSTAYTGGNNIGHVPTGGTANTFLKGNGSFSAVNQATDVTGILTVENGGTGFNTYNAGSILYAASSSALTRLNIGANGKVLKVVNNVPAWADETGTTYTAGNGLELSNANVFAADLLANGGLQFSGQNNELQVNLSASNIAGGLGVSNGGTGLNSIDTLLNENINYGSEGTGTLPVDHGGTGRATTTTGDVLRGNGTSQLIADRKLSYNATTGSLQVRGTQNNAPTIAATLSIDDCTATGKRACIGLAPISSVQGGKGMYISMGNFNEGIHISRDSGNASAAMRFLQTASGSTEVGSIILNNSATAYNTSSDYRLKENIVDMTGAVDRVKQLLPKRFNFKNDTEITVDGFLAHEAQTVVPESVTGTKDEVDANGDAVYQGIDQSKLVPLLVGAIKELTARIEALEA